MVRSQIVLLAAEGRSYRDIAARLHVRPVTVTRWLRRFALLGPEGLRRDAPRSVARVGLASDVVQSVVAKTLRDRPPQGRYWTTRSLAREVGVSHSSVRRIWRRLGIDPTASRLSRLAQWAGGASKRVDVVGLFFDPPRWAVALSLSPNGRAAEPGPVGPALGPLTDLASCIRLLEHARPKERWRSLVDQEFLAFLSRISQDRPPDERVHLIAGSDEPLSPSVERWLGAHREISMGLTPDPASLDRSASRWAETVRGPRGADSPLPSLPQLRSEVQSWAETADPPDEPFAWIRDGAGRLARAPSRSPSRVPAVAHPSELHRDFNSDI